MASITIKFNANGGTNNTSYTQTTYTSGNTNVLPAYTAFTRTGYELTGFKNNNTGTLYPPGQTITDSWINNRDGQTFTFYAQWTTATITLKFDAGAGSCSTSSKTFTYNGSGNTLPTATPPSGKTFDGWYWAKTGTTYPGGQTMTNSWLDTWKYSDNGISGYETDMTFVAQYTALPTYTLSYNANGGSGTTSSHTGVTSGTSVTLRSNGFTAPNSTGSTYTYTFKNGSSTYSTGSGGTTTSYSFGGWKTSSSGSYAQYSAGSSYTVYSNTTMYAHWSSSTSTTKITFPSGLTKTGHTFLGWSTSSSATSAQYAGGASVTPTSNQTYYAVWKADTYTITYNANGGSNAPSAGTKTYDTTFYITSSTPTAKASESISYTINFNGNGGSATETSKSTTATRTYSFSHWNTNSSGTGTTYYSGGAYSTNADLTLYAIWSDSTSSPTAITLPTATRNNYNFLGWSTSSQATTATYSGGEAYTPSSTSETLYAVWELAGFELSVINGATDLIDSVSGEGLYPEGTSCTVNATLKTITGYQVAFEKWTSNNSILVPDSTEISYSFSMPGEAITLTATATKIANTYTITYNPNGGIGEIFTSTHTYDVSTNLNINSFSKTGHTFIGWSTDSTAIVAQYVDEQEVSNLTDEQNGNIELFAIWQPNTYTLTYDVNGGEGSIADATWTYSDVSNLNITDIIPTRENYSFLGWSEDANAVTAEYSSGQAWNCQIAENVTLYAIWQADFELYIHYIDTKRGVRDSIHVYGAATDLMLTDVLNSQSVHIANMELVGFYGPQGATYNFNDSIYTILNSLFGENYITTRNKIELTFYYNYKKRSNIYQSTENGIIPIGWYVQTDNGLKPMWMFHMLATLSTNDGLKLFDSNNEQLVVRL